MLLFNKIIRLELCLPLYVFFNILVLIRITSFKSVRVSDRLGNLLIFTFNGVALLAYVYIPMYAGEVESILGVIDTTRPSRQKSSSVHLS